MKACIACGQILPLQDFYVHSKMADGHLNKCKRCCKEQAVRRYNAKKNDAAWVERERTRGREKYHRLGYVALHTGSGMGHKRWAARYPEKKRAYQRCQYLPCPPGFQRHHWSYKEEHALDVFLLPQTDHYRLHQVLRYDSERWCYRTPMGELLDTREKHETYLRRILNG